MNKQILPVRNLFPRVILKQSTGGLTIKLTNISTFLEFYKIINQKK